MCSAIRGRHCANGDIGAVGEAEQPLERIIGPHRAARAAPELVLKLRFERRSLDSRGRVQIGQAPLIIGKKRRRRRKKRENEKNTLVHVCPIRKEFLLFGAIPGMSGYL